MWWRLRDKEETIETPDNGLPGYDCGTFIKILHCVPMKRIGTSFRMTTINNKKGKPAGLDRRVRDPQLRRTTRVMRRSFFGSEGAGCGKLLREWGGKYTR
jgi:hypothetical protein